MNIKPPAKPPIWELFFGFRVTVFSCLHIFSTRENSRWEERQSYIYSPKVKSSNVKDELLERGRVDRPWLETLTVHRILHRCHRSELINHRLIDFWGRGTTDELLSGRHLSCDQNKTREPSAGSYLKGICCNPCVGNMGPTIEPRYRGGSWCGCSSLAIHRPPIAAGGLWKGSPQRIRI